MLSMEMADIGLSFWDFVWGILGDVIGSMITFGFAGFILGFMIMGIGAKFGWFKRKYILLKFLRALYWIYIPLALAFCGVFYGAIYAAHSHVSLKVHAAIQPLTEASFTEFQGYIDANRQKVRDAEASVEETVSDFFSWKEEEEKDMPWWERPVEVEDETGGFKDWIIKWGLELLIEKSKEKAAEATGLEVETVESIIYTADNLNVEELNKEVWGTVEGAIMGKVDAMFSKLYMQLLILIFILLAVPIIETSISVVQMEKRKKLEASKEQKTE